jgi:SagB-type dehydrogenase family enzyme
MSWIDLGNPTPLEYPQPHSPVAWPGGKVRSLCETSDRPTRSFMEVAETRRTRRTFESPGETRLSQLFSMTCRAHSIISREFGFPQTTRSAPSAGAIHPVHVILHGIDDRGWSRYDPFEHALVDLPSRLEPSTVRSALDPVLPSDRATLLLFAAEPALTFAKYREACSLIWRDAGILQGYFSAAAEALDLNFCLIGVTGEPWVSQLVDENALVGVGAAYVGSAT